MLPEGCLERWQVPDFCYSDRNTGGRGTWFRGYSEDLERAADFTRKNDKERERYKNVQHHLSEFDGDLRAGKFDKGKLDDAIDNLKDVVKNNTLESHDRDALAQDLSDLRTLKDLR